MAWLLSYLGANWSLIIVVALLVVALILFAILAKNLWAIFAAIVLLALGFAYAQIDKTVYQRAAAEQLADKLKTKDAELEAAHDRINVLNAAYEADAMQALTDADEISKLQARIHETPPDTTIALNRAAAGRVRAFKRAASGRTAEDRAAARTGRHPSLLSGFSWGRKPSRP